MHSTHWCPISQLKYDLHPVVTLNPPTCTNQLCGFPALKLLPGLHTLADLLLLWDHLEGWQDECVGQLGVHRRDLFPQERRNTLHLTLYGRSLSLPPQSADLVSRWDPYHADRCPLWEQVNGLFEAIPASWRLAARQVLPSTGTSHHLHTGPVDWAAQSPAVHCLLSCLGWEQPAAQARRRSIALLSAERPFTVRAATTLQLVSNAAARDEAHRCFVLDALSPPPQPPASEARISLALHTLRAAMTQLWRFQLMENLYKEPLWRLAVNGVAAAGGHGISMAGPCP